MTHLLPRSTPELQSVPAAAISRLISALDGIDQLHTLTVVRHGHVIAEATWAPYQRELPTAMYSVSKSFTSIAVGLAVSEGLLAVDDRVVDLIPEFAPEHPSEHLRALRVRHLLTMTTGHSEEPPLWEGDWVRAALAADLPYEPGTHWLYNTPATHVLSQIVQVRTGQRLLDYLRPRLFDPLGFRDPLWQQSPAGVDAGGFGLFIRPEELAAFGQLLLDGGVWRGRRLVPAEWIDQATSKQVANEPGDRDWNQGYGFQFWRCRHGAYRGDGAFGQYVVVLPEHDAVVAITGGLPDMQQPLDAIWEFLLPAFDLPAPAPAPAAAVDLPTPVPAVGGELRPQSVAYEYDGVIRSLRVAEGVVEIDGRQLRCVPDSWSIGEFPEDPSVDRFWYGDQVAISGGWKGETFTADVRLLQDASTFRLVLDGSGHLRVTRDVGFDGTEVWEGDPAQSDVVAHHSAVSP
ncbi:serine hydrolase domain-containing protein [Microbacterium hibisci]|uniref:serine hydrolase domain-containing protein n=1 Tax=Microbacterium hibisci TaxID=2036000 RepID=UPI0019459363|nr:serine hydrolase [Microbacterium hibisci]